MFLTRLLGVTLFAVLALALPAAAEDITFSGEVTYRERLALPDGAQLLVTLVSLPANRALASAAAPIADGGQVPLAFVLDVRSNVLRAEGQYGLLAEIRAGGRRLFHNALAVSVDPATPSAIRIVTHYDPAPLAASAPTEDEPSPAAPDPLLHDTSWIVTSIGGDPALPATTLTLSFGSDLRAGGSAGCNSYFAEIELDATVLRFGPLAGTRLACEQSVMVQEARLLAALAATAGYERNDDALQLRDAAGVTLAGLILMP